MLSVLVLAVLALPAALTAPAPASVALTVPSALIAYRHLVDRPAAADHRRRRRRRAAQRHILRGQPRDRLTEDHREMDRSGTGRVRLTRGLIDADRGIDRIDAEFGLRHIVPLRSAQRIPAPATSIARSATRTP